MPCSTQKQQAANDKAAHMHAVAWHAQGMRTLVLGEVAQVGQQVRLHEGPHLRHRPRAAQLARRGVGRRHLGLQGRGGARA